MQAMSTLNSIKDQFRAILRRVESAFGARAAGFASLKLRVSALYVGGLLICLVLQGFASIEPLSLGVIGGDNVFTLNYAKNYINGNGFRINPNLGFPGVQDNLFFPSFDFAYRLFLKGVGAFATEAATSYYLMYLAGACAMFAATASSLRSLGFGHLISVFGSLIYVVSPYFVFRSLNHDFLALYFSAPLGATLALQIGTLPTTQTTRSFFFQRPRSLIAAHHCSFWSLLRILLDLICAVRGHRCFLVGASLPAGPTRPDLRVNRLPGLGYYRFWCRADRNCYQQRRPSSQICIRAAQLRADAG